jgi:hypothetical protein
MVFATAGRESRFPANTRMIAANAQHVLISEGLQDVDRRGVTDRP